MHVFAVLLRCRDVTLLLSPSLTYNIAYIIIYLTVLVLLCLVTCIVMYIIVIRTQSSVKLSRRTSFICQVTSEVLDRDPATVTGPSWSGKWDQPKKSSAALPLSSEDSPNKWVGEFRFTIVILLLFILIIVFLFILTVVFFYCILCLFQ